MKRIIHLLLSFLLLSLPAWATPTISSTSGTLSHSSSFTISGSGFTTKTTASPLLYDDFDAGTTGATICDGGGSGVEPLIHAGYLSSYNQWVMDGGGSYSGLSILYNATSPVRTGSKHSRATISTSACWGLDFLVPVSGWYTATGKEIYVSFMYRMSTPSANPRQTKAIIGYSSSWDDYWYYSTAFGSSCEASTHWRTHTKYPEKEYNVGVTGTSTYGEWIRIEQYMKQSDASTTNGVWNSYMHRPTLSTPTINAVEQPAVALRQSTTNVTKLVLGGAYYNMCSGTQEVSFDVDEIYVDSTPARVELGNASTWSACTKRVLQIPSAWSDTSITFTVNQGNFTTGTTVYVYVVDSSGNVNATGKSVTVGGTDTTPPTLLSSVVNAAGTTLTRTFDEAVYIGAGGSGGWSPTFTVQGATTSTLASGNGTNVLVFNLNNTVLNGEDGTDAYTNPGNGIEDAAGNDLATISDFTINNGSTVTPSITITGPTTGSTYTTSNGTLHLSGTATGDHLDYVQWANAGTGADDIATGTSTWSCDIPLAAGTNAIIAVIYNLAGGAGYDYINVTYNAASGTATVISGCTMTGIEIK